MAGTTSNHAAKLGRSSRHDSGVAGPRKRVRFLSRRGHRAAASCRAACGVCGVSFIDTAFGRFAAGPRGGARRVGLGLLAALGVWLAWVSVASASERVYWTNYAGNTLSYASVDGSGGAGELNTTGAVMGQPAGVAVDPATGRIYWANFAAETISYANLDGSGGDDLNTSGAMVDEPAGLAVDPANGRVYWDNDGTNTISYANADGSGGAGELNTTGATINAPSGITVDPAGGRVYWDNDANTISYANLDGSGGGNIDTSGATVDEPFGIAFNPGDGRVYWTNAPDSTLDYARVDAPGLGGTLPLTGVNPIGLAIDPVAERAYWTDGEGIAYAGLDVGGGAQIDTTGATTAEPTFLVLVAPPVGVGAPVLTGGSVLGMTLSCSKGSWAPDQPSSFYYRSPFSYTYTWFRDGAPIPGQTASTIATAASGTYACAVTGSNTAGAATQTSAPHTVSPLPPSASPAGSPNPPPAAPGARGTALSIGPIRQAHVRWVTRRLHPSPADRKPPPYGTTFAFQLDLPAHLTLTFTGERAGRWVNGRCRAATDRNRHAAGCTYTERFGSLITNRSAGRAQIRFYGHLENRQLPAGRYTLTVTATAPNQQARVRTISFTIANIA